MGQDDDAVILVPVGELITIDTVIISKGFQPVEHHDLGLNHVMLAQPDDLV